MRILVVGAGSVGGYFGGRLLDAGRDVTFLVRAPRAAALARTGLVVHSTHGNLHVPVVQTVTADMLASAFDVVLLSCKAYDLAGAMDAMAPAVGSETVIVPLLNGMRHLDDLDTRFGADKVFGGQCAISSVLDAEGRVLHLNRVHQLSFGERSGERSPRALVIEDTLTNAGFDSRLADDILQEMWEKWTLIATGAGATCLMRGAIGDIVAAGATDMVTGLLAECTAIGSRNGHTPGAESLQRITTMFTTPGSLLTASMFRDIEAQFRIEGDHIIGDLLARGGGDPYAYPLLHVVHAHLRVHEARRAREQAAST